MPTPSRTPEDPKPAVAPVRPLGASRRTRELVLLCERCGYDIGSLDAGARCPECGTPRDDSLPGIRRPGSPWQRRATPLSWLLTSWGTVVSPQRLFRSLRVSRAGWWLAILNTVVAAVILGLPPDKIRHFRVLLGLLPERRWKEIVESTASHTFQTLAAALVLLALVGVEYLGIRFISRRRGLRFSRAAAWQVCAHASIGWLLAGIVRGIVESRHRDLFNALPMPAFDWLDRNAPFATTLFSSGTLLGFLSGMIAFELLVYIGMRQCRWANAPAAGR